VSEHHWLGPKAILDKKKQFLIPCMYHFYQDPPQFVRGQGMHLYDSQGKEYLDFYAGVSVHALGHCHPEMTEAICRQVRTLQHTTTIYLTEPIVLLAEKLAQILPGNLSRSFFCCSGSEANEGAALLATLYTGRNTFLALHNSLHGRTKLDMSLTGLDFWRTDPNPVAGVIHVPMPTCNRCPFDKRYGSCSFECVRAVEQAIVNSTTGIPAAMFIEPIQGNGGIQIPPPEYFTQVRDILNRYGILLIADEVQTGFGRTGRMFGLENWGVIPDILTGGKALGGGTPIGFFSTTDEIASAYTRPGASTFGGNPVTAIAGLSFLYILCRDLLPQRAARMGEILKQSLCRIQKDSTIIRDVRGKGLMIGAEIQAEDPGRSAGLTDRILEAMKDRGVLLGKTGAGRNVLTFMPPLIVEESQIGRVMDELETVLHANQ
jgi:4-aminobutyrate aminotransferase-like enzyme